MMMPQPAPSVADPLQLAASQQALIQQQAFLMVRTGTLSILFLKHDGPFFIYCAYTHIFLSYLLLLSPPPPEPSCPPPPQAQQMTMQAMTLSQQQTQEQQRKQKHEEERQRRRQSQHRSRERSPSPPPPSPPPARPKAVVPKRTPSYRQPEPEVFITAFFLTLLQTVPIHVQVSRGLSSSCEDMSISSTARKTSGLTRTRGPAFFQRQEGILPEDW